MNVPVEEIKSLIRNVGDEIMKVYNRDFEVSYKNNKSLVTEADLLADKLLMEGLEKYGYPILSEETDDTALRLNAEYVWIIDPIDGTNGFVEKNGEFAIMVGLSRSGIPVLGFVYDPVRKMMYYAEKGCGSFLDDGEKVSKMSVSNESDIEKSRLLTSPHHISKRINALISHSNITSIVALGGIGLKIAKMVEGSADIYFSYTNQMGQWDLCAPQIILEEAGGKLTGILGEEIVYNIEDECNQFGVLATNNFLHREACEKIMELDMLNSAKN